jgi:hypothetical protein
VPHDKGALAVVDVRCLEKPTSAQTLKSQGWTVLPIFGDGGQHVDSGVHQLPLFDGAPTLELLAAISKLAKQSVREWQHGLARLSHAKQIKVIDGASVTVSLLDAQRYGEMDWQDMQPPCATVSRVRLPTSFEARYLKAMEKRSKPLKSYVGKVKGKVPEGAPRGTRPPHLTEEELLAEANRAFLEAMGSAMGLPQPEPQPPLS